MVLCVYRDSRTAGWQFKPTKSLASAGTLCASAVLMGSIAMYCYTAAFTVVPVV